MKLAIIREGKIPPDARTPLTPAQCHELLGKPNLEIAVQSSLVRCFNNSEYMEEGVRVVDDVSDFDILMGVKEVPVDNLIEGKTYFMFSHTIKKQPYNRDLLRAIIRKNIRLIDYEVLTDEKGFRLIAFGKFAGMVGAHNALWTFGQRTGTLSLPRMSECKDYAEVKNFYKQSVFPKCKVVLTGTGRVANGAAMVLDDMGFQRVDPEDFVEFPATAPTYTQLGVTDYATHKDNKPFGESEYFKYPEQFIIDFSKYYQAADIMINGIYWDPAAPVFFTASEMRRSNFRIRTIADVTCDIAPESSIPSTLRPATIAEPVYGYETKTGKETRPYQDGVIDMMTIDNLPNELPRDASGAFGEQFIAKILPELFKSNSDIIERATIAKDGQLGIHFGYLADYVEGEN